MIRGKISLLLVLQFLVLGFLSAQTGDFKPVKDELAFRKQFSTASNKIQSIKSDFVQEKNLKMLSDKIVSKGQFQFKKQKKIRLEYLQPYKYLMIINDNDITIKDDQKTNKMSAKSNRMFRQINDLIADCLQGTAVQSKDYTVLSFENGNQYLLKLTPVAKTMKEFFQNIQIFIDKKDFTVVKLEMNEKSGDNTIIRFTHKELNIEIPDAVFVVK